MSVPTRLFHYPPLRLAIASAHLAGALAVLLAYDKPPWPEPDGWLDDEDKAIERVRNIQTWLMSEEAKVPYNKDDEGDGIFWNGATADNRKDAVFPLKIADMDTIEVVEVEEVE